MKHPINSIEIKKFRGIENFKIEKFSKINILLGENNIGKTSILEAIFLLTGMSNPTLPNLINAIRTEGETSMKELGWLFYNKDINSPIIISDRGSRSVQITPILGLENGSGLTPTYSVSGLKINGLKLLFNHKGKEGNVSFHKKDSEITINRSDYNEKIIACSLPANALKANLFSNIKAIIRKNKKAHLVDIIKLFDNKTLNVEIINDEVYVQLSNINDLIPISFIGDGLQHFIGICSAVLNPENKVVLVDEIDNGLHYTVLKQLWKSLIKLSIENSTQLFITTHNEESLKSLAAVLEEEEEDIDLSVFSIQMTKNAGLKASQYTAQALQGAIGKEIEIR